MMRVHVRGCQQGRTSRQFENALAVTGMHEQGRPRKAAEQRVEPCLFG